MKDTMKRQTGFTLIELIMVIVILGFLGVVAVPLYVNMSSDAAAANEIGVAGGIRSGILTFYSDPAHRVNGQPVFPTAAEVDAAAVGDCTDANPCFTGVLGQGGITAHWKKLSATTWRSPVNGTNVWTYTSGNGTFMKTTV